MPQIIVVADGTDERDNRAVTLRERISAADFESERFAVNLVERLGWAVSDASEVERAEPPRTRSARRAASHEREPVPA